MHFGPPYATRFVNYIKMSLKMYLLPQYLRFFSCLIMIFKRYILILLVLELFQGIYFCELRANFLLCAVNEYLINKSNECFASAVAILNSVWKSSERIKFNSIENFQFYSYKSELKLALSTTTRTKRVIREQSIVQQIWTVGNGYMSNDRPNTFEQLHPFIYVFRYYWEFFFEMVALL